MGTDSGSYSKPKWSRAFALSFAGILLASAIGIGLSFRVRGSADVKAGATSLATQSDAFRLQVRRYDPKTWDHGLGDPFSNVLYVNNGVGYTSQYEVWNDIEKIDTALMGVTAIKLSDVDIAELLREAKDAGLDSDHIDYGTPEGPASDTIQITFTLNGKVHRHSFDEAMPTKGLTAEQQDARRAVEGLGLPMVVEVADTTPFDSDQIVWMARRVQPDTNEGADFSKQKVAWPLPDLLTGDSVGCTVSVDDEGNTIRQALRDAERSTPWATPDGSLWQVSARFALPNEDPCA